MAYYLVNCELSKLQDISHLCKSIAYWLLEYFGVLPNDRSLYLLPNDRSLKYLGKL